MNETALQAAIRASTLVWIHQKKIKNEKGKLIDVGPDSPHFFLRALYLDRAKEIATQKPSQIGVSTWAILTELHDARFWGINQIHTLPTGADVQKFVPSKTNEIIKQNPAIKEGLAGKEVDAVGQKQFGKAFLYYKGTHSEREALMLSSDRNWYDEIDKSDMTQIGNYESRLEGADSLREKRYISTPTIPNYGVNEKFELSDQKYWRFPCGHCKKKQHMTWPENIDMIRMVYICKHCHKEINSAMIRQGDWQAKFPGRDISGYQLTQMIAPWITPKMMVEAYRSAETGKNDMTMEYFFNHKLGLPYMESSTQIPKSLVLQNLLPGREHLETESIMGVDVQLHELYCIMGSMEGIYGILRLRSDEEYIQSNGVRGKSKWDRWAEIMDTYGVTHCVIDAGFTPNEVAENAAKFEGRVWMQWYKEDPKRAKIMRWAEPSFTSKGKTFQEEYQVLTDRNRAIDMLLQQTKQGYFKFFYASNDPAIDMLIKHIGTTVSQTVTDRFGQVKREWVSKGKDDLLHAWVNFMVAQNRHQMDRAK